MMRRGLGQLTTTSLPLVSAALPEIQSLLPSTVPSLAPAPATTTTAASVWSQPVVWVGGIASIALVAGSVWFVMRKRKKAVSPNRKRRRS